MYGKERVHLGQANKIKAIANSKSGTDFSDARWLACLTYEGRLPEATTALTLEDPVVSTNGTLVAQCQSTP
jgi:hypothetical protein